ncbi:MAG: FliM/FliN family flagellar motor switch protein [Pseudomonadota bacterium]
MDETENDAPTPAPAEAEAGAGEESRRERRGSAVLGVPLEVVISVGRARPMVSDLVNLRRDSVLPLDSRIDDPVEILIGDRLIARGELQEMDDDSGRLAVRLTEVADLSQGV